jgi:glutamate---cysteine ligase / carboxylate-amine ligase
MSSRELQIGAEEEFHVVDLETRRSTPEVDALLGQLDGEEFAPELQRSLVETNTPVCDTLDELRAHLQRLRGRLAEAAEPHGLGVVAAGTVPLVDVDGGDISAGARFAHMQHEYQVLVNEQHICGAQIHVDVPDRDEAVQVVRRVAPHLPTLLAISASSPYWNGRDTGYASYRDLIWARWPTAGPPPMLQSGAEYDGMIQDLIASGTISDPGMVYFDVRPSAHVPTVELRICDACPEVDFVVLIAGLFRALVRRSRDECAKGVPFPDIRQELLRAATWRAARSGLEGDLVTPAGSALISPALLVGQLVDSLRPHLEALGDFEQVLELSQMALGRGSAAARQRRRFGLRGELTDVVDGLLAATQGTNLPFDKPPAIVRAPQLLGNYRVTGFDEAVSEEGNVLPQYGWMFRTLSRMGLRGMEAAEKALHTEQRARGVTFRVDDEPERLFPLDLLPRIITADDWAGLTVGLTQRVRALEAFLRDVYGERQIIADGVVPASVVDDAPGRTHLGKLVPEDAVRIAVAGIDLVRDRPDHWMVLEDNLRVPSGMAYSVMIRRLIRSAMPDLEPPTGVVPLEDVPRRLRSALLSAVDPDRAGYDEVALLSAGPVDSAFFEHKVLAERMGVPVVTPRDLQVTDDGVFLVGEGGRTRLSALYRRIDEIELMDSAGADLRPIGRALGNAVRRGNVALLNGFGNGVADDKLTYAYVPEMIAYYLDEKPILDNVPTYPCVDPERRAEVLDRLDELVLKPVNGYGGKGIVIGPHSSQQERDQVAAAIRAEPALWVAQDMVTLSTLPTFAAGHLQPRAVDLRAFVLQSRRGSATDVDVLPATLSRVAPADSLIVNSSRGGGAKDTWVLK